LRIAARASRTYRMRRHGAAFAGAIFLLLYWHFGGSSALAGIFVSKLLCLLCFLFAAFSGIIFTADSISAEKREGTLGLLFLTNLGAREVIIGNALATSMQAFYCLLATFPVLGITTMLGGFSPAEFIRTCLALVSAMFFSLSLSLLVSTFSEKHLAATGRAALGMFGFLAILPGFCFLMRRLSPAYSVGWTWGLNLLSPSTTFDLARNGLGVTADFWWSLLWVNLLSAAMLAGSMIVLSVVWKDRRGRIWKWLAARIGRVNLWPQRVFRLGSIKGNPFSWLVLRERHEAIRFLVLAIILGLAATYVGTHYLSRIVGGRFPALAGPLVAWAFAGSVLHAVLMFKIAAAATNRFSEDRKIGAMELLLATPLNHARILRGQGSALVRMFSGPIIAVLFIHFLVLWGFFTLCSFEEGIPGGALGAFRAAFQPLDQNGPVASWPARCALMIIGGGGVLLFLHWFVVASVGMWIGLRTRWPSIAAWQALLIGLAPPLPIFGAIVIAGDWLGFSRDPFVWISFCFLLGFSLALLNAAVLLSWSWWNLLRNFRRAAVDRYDRVPLRIQRKLLSRAAIAAGLIVAGIVLFYREERWRGERAWHRLEMECAARGEKLLTAISPPPEIPDRQNFGAGDLFRPLFAYHFDGLRGVIWDEPAARQDLLTVSLTAEERNLWRSSLREPHANWAFQKAVSLDAWASYYRTNAPFVSLVSSNSAGTPAEVVVQALTLFAPELNELEILARRPLSRFPLHYSEGWMAFVPHRQVLHNFAEILQLRACARLHLNEPEAALRDIKLMVCLAQSIQPEIGLFPARVRQRILLLSLQPIWEGLAAHRWNEAQLRDMQRLCSVNLLPEYPREVRGETELMVDFWERFSQADAVELRRWGFTEGLSVTAKLYPEGWKLLCQAGMMRLPADVLDPVIDLKARRVFPLRAAAIPGAIRRAGVFFDPLFQMGLPKLMQSFADAPLYIAHAQTAMDMARIACALELSRLRNGVFPATLKEIKPEFIFEMPSDPITGDLYKYRREKDGFVLYSVGWNERDDGGHAAWTDKTAAEQNVREGDWVWNSTVNAPQIPNRK
jgi:hypothetical protein